MFELTDTRKMIEQAVCAFAQKEIAPHLEKLESGEMPRYEILKKFGKQMGFAGQGKGSFKKRETSNEGIGEKPATAAAALPGSIDPMIPAIVFKENSRVSPGLCMALVATLGCATAISQQGTEEQRERWAYPVFAMEKPGAGRSPPPAKCSSRTALMLSTLPVFTCFLFMVFYFVRIEGRYLEIIGNLQ